MENWKESDEYKRVLPGLKEGETITMPHIATGAFLLKKPDGSQYKYQLRHNAWEKEALHLHQVLLNKGWDLPKIVEIRTINNQVYTLVEWIEGVEDSREGTTEEIAGIKVIDDYTISFTGKEPYAPAITYLDMGILPEHILKDVPIPELDVHEFNYSPVASGPFKLTTYEPDRQVVLEANDDYYKGRPKIDKVIFRIASYEALLNAWLKQEIEYWQTSRKS